MAEITVEFDDLPARLLDWYAAHARELPWRVGPGARAAGERPDPYRVWLAEIMLQQTTIPHGARYFQAFTDRWPTVGDLAAAEDADVMAAWAGLGYYARARNLLKCAREVAARGGFPQTAAELLELPGIGPYTAGAIAALAFDAPAAAVDGNVERVFARLMALETPWEEAKREIRVRVESLVPVDRPAEFAEGLMDLGATICTPKNPNCIICPLSDLCAARAAGEMARYPLKPKKAAKPQRYGAVFVLVGEAGIAVERRPNTGLLGGMLGLPGSDWTDAPPREPLDAAPAQADWRRVGEVRHVFTHFALSLEVWRAEGAAPEEVLAKDRLGDLPSVFKKAAKLVLS
ncbi:MAG: A/G-specific adenine glycosylase [Pseudomonadota bacterium]